MYAFTTKNNQIKWHNSLKNNLCTSMHNMYLLTTNFDEILFRILRQVSLKKQKQNRTDCQRSKQILKFTYSYFIH